MVDLPLLESSLVLASLRFDTEGRAWALVAIISALHQMLKMALKFLSLSPETSFPKPAESFGRISAYNFLHAMDLAFCDENDGSY